MPKPVYMLCCQSGAQDTKTGRLSHFGVYTHIRIRDFTNDPVRADGRVVVRALPFRVVAVWTRTPEEPDSGYEAEVRMIFPPDGNESAMSLGPIAFGGDRLTLDVDIENLLFEGPGLLRVQAKLVHPDVDEESIQSYEIHLYESGDPPCATPAR